MQLQNNAIQAYLDTLTNQLEKRLSFSKTLQDSYFKEHSFEELLQDNHAWYQEVQQCYDTSYANPAYTASLLPKELAPICTWLYYQVQMMMPSIFQRNIKHIEQIVRYVDILKKHILDNPTEYLKDAVQNDLHNTLAQDFQQNYTTNNFTTKLLREVDLEDLRYIFRYGIYISNAEVELAQLIQKKEEHEILQLAEKMVRAYQKGFHVRNKKKTNRDCSRVVLIVGLERVGASILKLLQEDHQEGCIAQLVYKDIDPQVLFDHRQEEALFCDDAYMSHKKSAYQEVCELYKDALHTYLGNIIMVSFGQNKLDTTTKESAAHMNELQNKLVKQYEMDTKIIFETYVPKGEISFTGMAYPTREICEDNYEKIFQDVMEINLMDPTKHEAIQELLIDVFDQSDFVEIIGSNKNETNIKVKLPKLKDPAHQSNFSNCGADINIPIGEVFTSPQLLGTNGLLHIRKARISKIAFEDIRMEFEDGFVKKASCQNFDDPKKNDELIQDVIFHHRDTLPMGEFALGTNTFAYVKAKEDGILYKLHTLIFEKLGPHMAIGDTCFAWSEDNSIYSVHSGKELVAKDNEFSIARHEDVTKAYTGIHYDLTIPYDEIQSLRAHHYDGTITPIVENGFFVLEGCEYLNDPLKGDYHNETK
ncbi:aminopeptidase [Amedibacillus sp. YH-ame10]